MSSEIEIRHHRLFCRFSGGGRAFNRAAARLGKLRAKFDDLDAIDMDSVTVPDFEAVFAVARKPVEVLLLSPPCKGFAG